MSQLVWGFFYALRNIVSERRLIVLDGKHVTAAENRQSTLSIAGHDIMWKTKTGPAEKVRHVLSTDAS